MSIADAGLVASMVMLATVIIDWRRGISGLGKFRLTKEHSPDRFWMAVVLYLNMALLTFWLTGRAYDAAMEKRMEELGEGGVIILTERENES